jgi:hypothetical protein
VPSKNVEKKRFFKSPAIPPSYHFRIFATAKKFVILGILPGLELHPENVSGSKISCMPEYGKFGTEK